MSPARAAAVLKQVEAAATRHGDASGSEYEAGDLIGLLAVALGLLGAEQLAAFEASAEVREMLAEWGEA